MSIQLNSRAVVALIAVIGVLTGLALASVLGAVTGKPGDYPEQASAASTNQIVRQLKVLNNRIGSSKYDFGSLAETLYRIQINTGYVCREVSGSGLCRTIG